MNSRRLVTAVTAVALLAAACGTDDTIETADSVTTVPPTASPTTTIPAPDNPDEATTSTPSVGDINQAAVKLDPLVRLVQPIDAVVAPNGEWWIAQRTGEVLVVDPDTGVAGDVVLDINDETTARGERGLLGLAVDDEALYVNFTDLSGTTTIDAFVFDTRGRPGNRIPLLTIDQPFGNHNGGALAIGPDGNLYIGVGDGARQTIRSTPVKTPIRSLARSFGSTRPRPSVSPMRSPPTTRTRTAMVSQRSSRSVSATRGASPSIQ